MATRSILKGDNSPEGFIEADRGTFYINMRSSSVFVKMIGDNTTNKGWRLLDTRGYYTGEINPNGVIPAPKYAVYYNSVADELYTQTVYANPVSNEGWVCLNNGTILNGNGNPNVTGMEGSLGDIYLDNEAITIFVNDGEEWQQIRLITVDSSEILIKLSALLTNVTSLTNQYFDMFFNPNPMDIELSQYDSDGILRTYKVPNRAKDTITLMGYGSPEDNVYAAEGHFYLDVGTGIPYVKTTGVEFSTGWRSLTGPDFKSPLYVDETSYRVNIRTDDVPTEGSENVLSSGVIYTELNKIRNGSSSELFSAAEPIMQEHVTTKNYVDGAVNSLFGYDSSTGILHINTVLNQDVSEVANVLGENGVLFTPMFGTAFSTIFTFDTPLKEPINTYSQIRSEIPCEIIVTAEPFVNEDGETISDYEYLVDITDKNKSVRCFTDEMVNGIRKIKVISTPFYEYPTVNVIKDLYKQLTLVNVDKFV